MARARGKLCIEHQKPADDGGAREQERGAQDRGAERSERKDLEISRRRGRKNGSS